MRHQLAAYSPISLGGVVRGMLGAFSDRRDALRGLLEERFDGTDSALCGSGTEALQIALRIRRLETGDAAPIALPAFNCYDVATAAVAVGGPVMLYDIDPGTLGPDFASLGRVLRAGARVVVAAPLYGIPLEWQAIEALVEQHGATLIEDAAQGHGGTWRGHPLGSLGGLSTLSFGRGKGWTGGGGGAVVVRGGQSLSPRASQSAGPMREIRTLMGLAAQWLLGRPALYGLPRSIPQLRLGETTYRAPHAQSDMTRSAAATVLHECSASDREAEHRRRAGQDLIERIGPSGRVRFATPPADGVAGYVRLPARVPGGTRGLRAVENAGGLGLAQSYPTTLGDLPALAPQLVHVESSLPGGSELARDLITIPTHSLVRERDIERIVALLEA